MKLSLQNQPLLQRDKIAIYWTTFYISYLGGYYLYYSQSQLWSEDSRIQIDWLCLAEGLFSMKSSHARLILIWIKLVYFINLTKLLLMFIFESIFSSIVKQKWTSSESNNEKRQGIIPFLKGHTNRLKTSVNKWSKNFPPLRSSTSSVPNPLLINNV